MVNCTGCGNGNGSWEHGLCYSCDKYGCPEEDEEVCEDCDNTTCTCDSDRDAYNENRREVHE